MMAGALDQHRIIEYWLLEPGLECSGGSLAVVVFVHPDVCCILMNLLSVLACHTSVVCM